MAESEKGIGIIGVGNSAEEVPAFPPPPVEQGMRYTVDVDIPIENDILAVQFLHHLRQGLQQHFGENLALNLRNKRRIPHAPPGLPNNDLPPAPPNNGPPPPHNPGQDPHNNNINESYYDSKEESARLKQQERATLKRKKRKQREAEHWETMEGVSALTKKKEWKGFLDYNETIGFIFHRMR